MGRLVQPLRPELPKREVRAIETKRGIVRLLLIAGRARLLLGDCGARVVDTLLEPEATLGVNPLRGMLFTQR